MHTVIRLVVCAGIMFFENASAAPEITDTDLRKSADALSASTLIGGDGWKVYEQLLHPDYARWAMGEVYEGREKFVRSLEDWWNYGMRVAERDIEIVAVDMIGEIAIIRFRTTESLVGPDGLVEQGFSGFVSNTWVKEDGRWLLLSADISSADRAD